MMCKMKPIAGLSALLLAAQLILPTAAAGQNWYCIRGRDNRQPEFGSDLRWVEAYDGCYLDRAHGDGCADRVVYLTFDAGYENGNVEKILNILRDEGVSAAFFILGNLIERNPELVCRMAAEGHSVCNHTYHHPDMTTMPDKAAFVAELEALEQAYTALTGLPITRCYRPPEGRFNRDNLIWAKEMGYKTVFWSFAYADWDNAKQPSHDAAREKILSNLHNGSVILLHPTSATNAEILGEIIAAMKADGWRFGRLDELTGAGQ